MDEAIYLLNLLEEQAGVEAETRKAVDLHTLADTYATGCISIGLIAKVLYPIMCK